MEINLLLAELNYEDWAVFNWIVTNRPALHDS